MEKQIKILSPHGLHARPAGLFAKKAMEFKSSIKLKSEKGSANAKSIMSVMSLGLEMGSEVTLVAEGEDENAAVLALETLLTSSGEH